MRAGITVNVTAMDRERLAPAELHRHRGHDRQRRWRNAKSIPPYGLGRVGEMAGCAALFHPTPYALRPVTKASVTRSATAS